MKDDPNIQSYVDTLNQGGGLLQRYAAGMLGRLGDIEAVKPLIATLRSDSKGARSQAARSLIQLGEPAVPELIAALGDENRETWMLAAAVLVKIGTAAVPALLNALREDEESVRILASEVLGQIGDQTALNGLIEVLDSDNANVRAAAAVALARMGERAVPTLIELMVDFAHPKTRRYALEILKQIGPNAALVDIINQSSELERGQAAYILGEMGEVAVPMLTELSESDDENVRYAAAHALGQTGSPTAIPALSARLKDEAKSMFSGLRVCDVAAKGIERIRSVKKP